MSQPNGTSKPSRHIFYMQFHIHRERLRNHQNLCRLQLEGRSHDLRSILRARRLSDSPGNGAGSPARLCWCPYCLPLVSIGCISSPAARHCTVVTRQSMSSSFRCRDQLRSSSRRQFRPVRQSRISRLCPVSQRRPSRHTKKRLSRSIYSNSN